MSQHEVVSKAQWIEARRALLQEEKAWTRERDRLSQKRRALPWVKVEQDYRFESTEGVVTLAELFDGRRQLIVYHFMFGPGWDERCPGCSLLADQVDGARQHFEHNDVTFVAVSRGPLEKSAASDFNFDYNVSFPNSTREDGVFYNFEPQPDPGVDELPGVSVFYRDQDGTIYHTYSAYSRGAEMFLPVYSWLDIVPAGRNETARGNLGDWVKRHDRYEGDGRSAGSSR